MDAKSIIRRNSIFMVLEGAFFYVALSFIPNETIVADFIDYTSGSVTLAGLAATISSLAFYLGEFICGLFIHKVQKQLPFMRKMGFLSRSMLMVFAIALLLGVKGPVASWLLIIAYLAIFIVDGFVGLCWNQILARTIPVNNRGVIFSIQQSVCGATGIFIGFALQRILTSALPKMSQFKLVFLISSVVFMLSVCSMLFFKDIPHKSYPDNPIKNPVTYLKELLPLFTKHQGVRQLIIGRVLFTMALISAPINYKFGVVCGLTNVQLSYLVFMPFIGQMLAGLFWSQISKRTNYPTMMIMGQLCGIFCSMANIAALIVYLYGGSVFIPLSAAMLLIKFTNVASNAFTQHAITLVDEKDIANTIVIVSLFTAPATFGTTLAGAIADWAFWPVYAIMLVSGLFGAFHTYHYFISSKSPLPEDQRLH